MILGISLHLGMTTQTAVSIFDLDLYFTVHRLCKFAWRNIAVCGILVIITMFFLEISKVNANSVDPDQLPHFVGLHGLLMSLLWDARHKWVNTFIVSLCYFQHTSKHFSGTVPDRNYKEWFTTCDIFQNVRETIQEIAVPSPLVEEQEGILTVSMDSSIEEMFQLAPSALTGNLQTGCQVYSQY